MRCRETIFGLITRENHTSYPVACNIYRTILRLLSICAVLMFSGRSPGQIDDALSGILQNKQIDASTLSIFIDKTEYTLRIMCGDQLIKSYAVVFGGNPLDDKLRQGDQCTPEGEFKIRGFYPHKSWSKFIWIDYPNESSWQKHRKAKEQGKIPSTAQIGGEIGIHGVPDGYDYAIAHKRNWTLGCISMTNTDVNEIYPFIFIGMKVVIQK
jgi:murein L,D-transpeptidase YafK